MYSVMLSLHVLVCLLVVLIVLIQSGKGAGFSGLFGGGSSDALFNAPSGSMFLRKVTTGLAVFFFASSILLTYLGVRQRVYTVTHPMSMPMPVGPETAGPLAPAAATPAQPAPGKGPSAPAAAQAVPAPAAAPTQKK